MQCGHEGMLLQLPKELQCPECWATWAYETHPEKQLSLEEAMSRLDALERRAQRAASKPEMPKVDVDYLLRRLQVALCAAHNRALELQAAMKEVPHA